MSAKMNQEVNLPYRNSFHKKILEKMANGDMGFYLLWAWVAVMIFVGVGFDTARRMRLSFSNDNVRIYYYNPYHMGHTVWVRADIIIFIKFNATR